MGVGWGGVGWGGGALGQKSMCRGAVAMSVRGFSWHSQLMMSSQSEAGSVDAQCDSNSEVEDQEVEIVIRGLSAGEVARVRQRVDSSLSIGHLWLWVKKALREKGESVPRDEELKFTYGNEVLDASMVCGKLFGLRSVQEGLRAAECVHTPILSFFLVRGSGGQMPGGGG